MNGSSLLVLIGHPDRGASRMNHQLAETWSELGAHVRWIDGKPLDVCAEQQAVEAVEHVILQFPLYWYGVPACLKQWLDEVLTWGWAFGPEGGMLHPRRLSCSVTIGGRLSDYTETGKHRMELTTLLSSLERTSAYIGMEWGGIKTLDASKLNELTANSQLKAWLSCW